MFSGGGVGSWIGERVRIVGFVGMVVLIGDIEIFGSNEYCLVEVSLIRSRDQQMNFEGANLFRHITESFFDKKYMAFIAPYVHEDTEFLLQSMTINQRRRSSGNCNHFYCMPMTTQTFIESIKSHEFLLNIENYSNNII